MGNNKKYIVHNDRVNCIGCGACEAVAPDFFEMKEDGKSSIKKGKKLSNGSEEIEIDEKGFKVTKEAADSCPVNVIHIIKKDSGEKII